jgi:hypothetical protein
MDARWRWLVVALAAQLVLALPTSAQEMPPEVPEAEELAAPAAGAPDGESGVAASGDEPQSSQGGRHFDLGLEQLALAGGPEFHAFPGNLEDWGEGSGVGVGWGGGLGGLGAGGWGPGDQPPPGLRLVPPPGLVTVATFDLSGEGESGFHPLRISRKSWDELDTWEKVVLVTSYASAVAGIAGLGAALVGALD